MRIEEGRRRLLREKGDEEDKLSFREPQGQRSTSRGRLRTGEECGRRGYFIMNGHGEKHCEKLGPDP